jgi:hypothetical protein
MIILSLELYSHFIGYTKRSELENTTEDTKASEDNKDGTKSNACSMGKYKTVSITHPATSAMHSPKKRRKGTADRKNGVVLVKEKEKRTVTSDRALIHENK